MSRKCRSQIICKQRYYTRAGYKIDSEKAENAEIRKMLAEDLANAFQAYINFVAPDLVSEDDKVSAEEVMETIDNIADVWRAFKPVSQKAQVIVRKLDRTADDIIADFLTRCGW